MQTVCENYDLYHELSPDMQCEKLAMLAHELTMLIRNEYELKSSGLINPGRVRTLNEIQHRLTSHLTALLREDSHRYPDEVIVNIIHDDADCAQAFSRLLVQRTSPTAHR